MKTRCRKHVTFTKEEWEQAKKKIELGREGIKDVHVLELDWYKKLKYGQSQRVNGKRLRQIEESVKANRLTRPAPICGVRRDGVSDAGRASRQMNQRTLSSPEPRPFPALRR